MSNPMNRATFPGGTRDQVKTAAELAANPDCLDFVQGHSVMAKQRADGKRPSWGLIEIKGGEVVFTPLGQDGRQRLEPFALSPRSQICVVKRDPDWASSPKARRDGQGLEASF